MVGQQVAEWVVPHLRADKPRKTTGEWDRLRNPGFQHGERKPQNLWLKKPVGVEAAGETHSLPGEFAGETHRVLECMQKHPPGNQHQKGPICLWAPQEVTENWQRAKQVKWFSFRPLAKIQHSSGLPCPGEYQKFFLLLHDRHAGTKEKKKSPKWKNTSKLQKKYN